MDDTISRQAAIELAMQYCPDDDGTCSKADEDIRNLLDELEDLPPTQPAQRWIPVSERLPDVAHRVLLSGHGQVMVGMLHSFGKYSLEPTGISYVYPKDDIEAWMPLPEPYKGGDTE